LNKLNHLEDIYNDFDISKYSFKNLESVDLLKSANRNVATGHKNVVVTIPFHLLEDKKESAFINVYSDFLLGNVHSLLLHK